MLSLKAIANSSNIPRNQGIEVRTGHFRVKCIRRGQLTPLCNIGKSRLVISATRVYLLRLGVYHVPISIWWQRFFVFSCSFLSSLLEGGSSGERRTLAACRVTTCQGARTVGHPARAWKWRAGDCLPLHTYYCNLSMSQRLVCQCVLRHLGRGRSPLRQSLGD